MQLFVFVLFGSRDIGFGKIYAGNLEAAAIQVNGMAPFSAGQVQNGVVRFWVQVIQELAQELLGLGLVAVFVQQVVIWRVEPGGVPGSFFSFHGLRRFGWLRGSTRLPG